MGSKSYSFSFTHCMKAALSVEVRGLRVECKELFGGKAHSRSLGYARDDKGWGGAFMGSWIMAERAATALVVSRSVHPHKPICTNRTNLNFCHPEHSEGPAVRLFPKRQLRAKHKRAGA